VLKKGDLVEVNIPYLNNGFNGAKGVVLRINHTAPYNRRVTVLMHGELRGFCESELSKIDV